MLTCRIGRLDIGVNPSRPIYLQIVEQIQRGILRGELDSGERLPSVRQLSLDLGVNPNTVARAYRELEVVGTIETRVGAGTFVTAGDSAVRAQRKTMAQAATRAWVDEMHALGVPREEALRLAESALGVDNGAHEMSAQRPAETNRTNGKGK